MRFPLLIAIRLIVLSGVCMGSVVPARAHGGASAPPADIARKVNAYMSAAVAVQRFSGSVMIVRDGQAIVSKGYGMANVEWHAPNTPKTVFRLASLSKQFTTAAIMLLQERGKLSIHDPFCKHLTNCPEAWRPITIRQLMTMTHGIPGVTALELGPLRGLPVPWDQWLEATGKKPLEFSPGEKFRYLNSGYTLLGFVIERVSGKPYGEFMQENVFGPLGMTQSGHEDPLRIIYGRATGYRQLPSTSITNVPYREIIRMYAGGGIYSTTEDLLLWDQSLYTEKLLSKKSIDEMFTPFKEMQPGKGYAYGWWSSQKFGRRQLAHGGNATGFITYIARYPSDRVTVIVLSNNERGSAGKVANDLSAIVFGARYDIPRERRAISLSPSILEKYVGQYQFQFPETSYTITMENGRLMMLEPGFPKDEMFAESETDFFLKTFNVQVRFVKDAKGLVTGVIAHQNDNTLFEEMVGNKLVPSE
jgi:CubicO group peptidase (beta-lactamase class C family)